MIHWLKVIQLAARSLMLHKFRSFLSILGIIFGVMAVIAMLAIGEGAKRETVRQIELLGTNNLIVGSLQLTESEQMRAEERQSPGLGLIDMATIRQLPGVSRVAAIRSYSIESIKGSGKPAVVGVTPDYFAITNLELVSGRFITDTHQQRQFRVCVLGSDAAWSVGTRRAVVGDTVRIGSEWFHVAGVLRDKDYSDGQGAAITPRNSNNDIYIPISVIPHGIEGGNESVDEIWVQATDAGTVSSLARAVAATLDRLHRGVTDYEVLVPHELLERKQQTQRIFNIVLGTVAGISLLVGGIGIMNIMLATVSERTREIGVCRALGASRTDIVIQFLAESVVLTVLGGLVGIAFGCAAAEIIAKFAGWTTAISWQSVIAAALISALVGIFFGLHPAQRAARMDPITALRSE